MDFSNTEFELYRLSEGDILLNDRTPDVVEFAVSPQVGQAVLAFARSYSNSGPDSVRAGRRHRLPHLRSTRHRKEWLSPFSPARQKLRGDIRSSERGPKSGISGKASYLPRRDSRLLLPKYAYPLSRGARRDSGVCTLRLSGVAPLGRVPKDRALDYHDGAPRG